MTAPEQHIAESDKPEADDAPHTESPAKSTGEVVDLLAALQRSIAAAKKGRVTPPASTQATP